MEMKFLVRFVSIACIVAAGFAQAASPFEKNVNSLLGVWFQSWDKVNGATVLRIVNVLNYDDKSATFVAYLGDPRDTQREVKSIKAYPEGDSIRLELASVAGSQVTAVLQGNDSLAGTFKPPVGQAFSLNLARSSLVDVQKWGATHPFAKVRGTRDSAIELVFVSARDCPSCLGWEQENLEKGKLKQSSEWPHLKFTMLKRESLKGFLSMDDVPGHLKPVFEQFPKGSMAFKGTPFFVLVVNGSIRAQGWGPAPYETQILPNIQAVVREKVADAGT
jgi:hypothetical protein